jgi:hypothetical protein
LQNIAEKKKKKVINTFCNVSLFVAKNKRTTRLISAALTHHLGNLETCKKKHQLHHHAAISYCHDQHEERSHYKLHLG